MKITTLRLLLGGFFAAAFIQCAGARTELSFSEARYPLSYSAYLYDASGRIVVRGHELQPVGTLSIERRFWGMLYSYATVSGEPELGAAINEQVRAAGGVGVVNLTVRTEGCGWNFAFLLTILPFWPGCATVTVSGEIVKAGGR
jgi:hypothetical protein